MKREGCCRVVLLLLFLVPFSGGAEDVSSHVRLELSGCASVSSGEVDRILSLELQSIAAGHHHIAARPIHVRVTCAPDTLTLVVSDNQTARFPHRVIRTDTHPSDGMDRVIAIAAAELALSTWEQLSADVDDTSPSAAMKTDPGDRSPSAQKHHKEKDALVDSVPESAPRARDRFRPRAALRISALWRMYLNHADNLFGGEIGGDLRFPRLLRMHLGITAEGGREGRPLGDVSLFSLSAMLSIGVQDRLFSSPLEGGFDIGFRGGYGRLTGKPHSPPAMGDALSGGWGGPMIHLFLASATNPSGGLSVELGYAVFGITGHVDTGRPVEMKGLWISVRLDSILQQKPKSDRDARNRTGAPIPGRRKHQRHVQPR